MIIATPAARSQAASRPVVLFDFDGTLANTLDGIRSTALATLRSLGWDDERIGDVNRLIGPPFPAAFTKVYGVDDQEAEKITHLYRAAYRQLGPEVAAPYEGIPQMLACLKEAGKSIGLASCKQEELAMSMAAAHGIDGYFEEVSANQLGQSISKPQVVTHALELFGVDGHSAVMVGDRADDICGAKANSALACGVSWGAGGLQELVEAGADIVVDTPQELVEVLLGLPMGT